MASASLAVEMINVVVITDDGDKTNFFRLTSGTTVSELKALWEAEHNLPEGSVVMKMDRSRLGDDQNLSNIEEVSPGSKTINVLIEEAIVLQAEIYRCLSGDLMTISVSLSSEPGDLHLQLRQLFGLGEDRLFRLRSRDMPLLYDRSFKHQNIKSGASIFIEFGYKFDVTDEWTSAVTKHFMYSSEDATNLLSPDYIPQRVILDGLQINLHHDILSSLPAYYRQMTNVIVHNHQMRDITMMANDFLKQRLVWPNDISGRVMQNCSSSKSDMYFEDERLPTDASMSQLQLPDHAIVHTKTSVTVKLSNDKRKVLKVSDLATVGDVEVMVSSFEGTSKFVLTSGGRRLKSSEKIKTINDRSSIEVERPGDTVIVHLSDRSVRFPTERRKLRFTEIMRKVAEKGHLKLHKLVRIPLQCQGCGRCIHLDEEKFQTIPSKCCRVRSLILTNATPPKIRDRGIQGSWMIRQKRIGEKRRQIGRLVRTKRKRLAKVTQTPQRLDKNQQNRSAVGASYISKPVMAYNPVQSTADWSQKNIGMKPPSNFQPQPLDPKTAPKPVHHPLPIDENFNESPSQPGDSSAMQKFDRIDNHAMEVSRKTQENFKQLIWQLIYARQVTDDLEKIRAIFIWLCTKDLSKINFVKVKENTPEDILVSIKSDKSTYAQIFQVLCQYAGVHCVIVSGYAKGAEFFPGMRFEDRTRGLHSWNVVLISGVWWFIDCHWAARRFVRKQASIEDIRYRLDMFYFLPTPAHLIHSHFPFDKEWQLLKDPLPLTKFESLALVKSGFFKHGLTLKTHKHDVVKCAQELTLKIGHPPGAQNYLSFTYTIAFADAVDSKKDKLEEWKGVKLLKFGMQEMTSDNCSTFTFRPPRPGAYEFRIYAKCAKERQPDAVFTMVCEYKIEADFPLELVKSPFPPCQQNSYGPHDTALRYQIVSFAPSAVLQAGANGVAEVRLRLARSGVRMIAKLRSVRHSQEQLAHCILIRHLSDTEVIVSVFPPEGGEFGLELYASDVQSKTTTYYMVWQYLILATEDSSFLSLPSIPAFLGPQPRFAEIGLETVSHVDPFIETTDPFIQTDTGDLRVQMRLHSGPLRITTKLFANNDDCSQYVLQQTKVDSVFFLLRFPRPGYYKFAVFALPYSDSSDSFPTVFNYLVKASMPSRAHSPFPTQYQHWKEGCYLHSPLDGQLRPSTPYTNFEMEIPKATAVAVVIGDDWTQLEQVGGTASERWRADVNMEKHISKEGVKRVSVAAKYEKDNLNYTTILEYSLEAECARS